VAIWLFLIFIALPIVEIALFIQVGGLIGVLPTIGLVILAAVLGVAVIRRRGMKAIAELQRSVETGTDPRGSIAHGVLVMLAGVMLVVPGFLTDAMALLLLVPAVRTVLIGWGASRATVRAATYVRTRRGAPPRQPETIDVEYEVVEEGPQPRAQGRSGWTQPH
jgi:UPF0716 protein FxsA